MKLMSKDIISLKVVIVHRKNHKIVRIVKRNGNNSWYYIRVQPVEEKLKYPGRHVSHCLPVTPGLHGHCPSYLAQMLLTEPVELQVHAEIERKV